MPAPNSLKIFIETFNDEAGYVGRIDNEKLKGIVVQSDTLKGVFEELITSLNVKLACDLGITVGGIEDVINKLSQQSKEKSEGHQELNLNLVLADN